MSSTLQDLKTASATLPAPQRAELAQFLLEQPDVLAHFLAQPREEGWADAWQEELARRLDDIRSGKVVGIPAGEVVGRLRERYP